MTDETRRYWAFYWPLALTGLAMILAAQFKNGILSRYPDAISELAVFAVATSLYRMCHAGIIFTPQMTNVLARTDQAARVCLRFVCLAACCLSLPLLICGFTPTGVYLIENVFNMMGEQQAKAILYLQLLSPLILITVLAQYYTGLLVQSERTGWVTILNTVMLITTIFVLLIGLYNGYDPVWVISLAHIIPTVVHLISTYVVYLVLYKRPQLDEPVADLTYKKALHFFYPVAFTSSMFATSRPVIYAFIRRTAEADLTIAILRIVFDFTMMFYNMLNQFRHLFVTFGREDRDGVRRFMIKIFAIVMSGMLIIAITPLHAWFLMYLLGVENEMHIQMAQEAILVLCLIPVFLTIRNYYHGIAMVTHKTGRMGISGFLRIISITGFTAACYYLGILNHITGAGALVAGFMAEGLSMWWQSRCPNKKKSVSELKPEVA